MAYLRRGGLPGYLHPPGRRRGGDLPGALDLERLRAYRASEVHGNAYRRPGRYGLLTERKIEPPFVRPDYRP